MERRDAEGGAIFYTRVTFLRTSSQTKVWNEAEYGERDWGKRLKTSPHTPYGRLRLARLAPLLIDIFTDFEKKPTVLQSIEQAIDPFCRFSFLCYCAILPFLSCTFVTDYLKHRWMDKRGYTEIKRYIWTLPLYWSIWDTDFSWPYGLLLGNVVVTEYGNVFLNRKVKCQLRQVSGN